MPAVKAAVSFAPTPFEATTGRSQLDDRCNHRRRRHREVDRRRNTPPERISETV